MSADVEYRVDVTIRTHPVAVPAVYAWMVDPSTARVDTYVAGFAEVRDGALVMTKARLQMASPADAHDWIILPLDTIAHAVMNVRELPYVDR